ncbi:hypothetical protein J6590_066815 [Homalodisca vitripennis]|nr:hypothetical protein J6590_066815 [Homalodisca vitripennis]
MPGLVWRAFNRLAIKPVVSLESEKVRDVLQKCQVCKKCQRCSRSCGVGRLIGAVGISADSDLSHQRSSYNSILDFAGGAVTTASSTLLGDLSHQRSSYSSIFDIAGDLSHQRSNNSSIFDIAGDLSHQRSNNSSIFDIAG